MDTADTFMGEERSAASGLSESEYESENPDHMIDNTTICPFVFSTYFDNDLERCVFSIKDTAMQNIAATHTLNRT